MRAEKPVFKGFSSPLYNLLHHFYTISAMIDISSLSVSSSTWQYKSIVICNELWPSNFCKVFGRIPFAIQFVAKVCLKQCGVNLSNFSVGFWALIRSTIYSIELRILLSWIGRFVLLVNTKSSIPVVVEILLSHPHAIFFAPAILPLPALLFGGWNSYIAFPLFGK